MMRRMDIQTIAVPRLAYSFSEAEVASGLSRSTLYRLIARGDLRSVKRGKRRLIPSDELRRLCGQEARA